MKIDYNKLSKATGNKYFSPSDILISAQKQIEFLYTHNKNFTLKQWAAIVELKEIIDSIKEA